MAATARGALPRQALSASASMISLKYPGCVFQNKLRSTRPPFVTIRCQPKVQEVGLATCIGSFANRSPDSKPLSSGLAIANLSISADRVRRKGERFKMKRGFLFLLFVTIAGAACAQEQAATPVVEVGLDYSLVHATSAPGGNQLTGNGGSGYVVYNLNRVLGLVADFGAYHNGNVNSSFNSDTTFTYLFGPRFSWRRWSRVTPYTQFLFGGARTSFGLVGGGGAQENGFALAAGAGIDIALTRHIAIKPIQLEYLMTQAPDFTGNGANVQNGLRYSAGLVFRFGEKAR